MVAIGSIDAVPLGPVARDIVRGYNEEPERYLDFIVEMLYESFVFYFQSYDEANDYCRKNRNLRDYSSRIWKREEACCYTTYLDMIVTELRGHHEELPRITTTLGPDIHRSEWIRSAELRNSVEELQKALAEAVEWFNIKMVADWLTTIDPWRMEWPDILKDIKPDNINQQFNLLDNFCYGQATMVMRTSCARAYDAIIALEDVPLATRNLFLLTGKQLREGARLRMGTRPRKEPDAAIIDEVAIDSEKIEKIPTERRTPGGIYLP